MSELQWIVKSKVGPIFVTASTEGLTGVLWERANVPLAKSPSENSFLAQAVKQIEEYLEGKRQQFDLKLQVQGTAFQKRVWQELSKIPYGKTVSYSDIARRIRNAKAVRAVGSANGRNPISIIVPCHRVIAADGTLGGYGGGLNVKTKLLEIENVRF